MDKSADKILWHQWLKSPDAREAFNEWKKKQLADIALQEEHPQHQQRKVRQKRERPNKIPPEEDPFASAEWRAWCRERDAKGLDY